jgi:translation initiation factor IF-1
MLFVVWQPAKGIRCGALTLLLVAAILSGCENIALIGRPTLESRGPPERVTATIDGADHQVQELYLLAGGNQHYVVRYLSGTRVTAQGQDYPAVNLRAGDRVEVELREGADNRLYADQVRVVGSGGASAATGIRNVEGTVERLSLARGVLELRSRSGELLTIYVPEASSAETRDRFHRVWVGDYVRLEGEQLSENRLELLAFR